MRALLLTLTMVAVYGQGLTLRDLPYVASRQLLATGCSQDTSAENAVFTTGFTYIFRNNTSLTGLSDSKTFTFSGWIQFTGSDGSDRCILEALEGSARLRLTRRASGRLEVIGRNSAGTIILQADNDTTVEVAAGWVHVFLSVNMANSSTRAFLIDNAGSATWTTFTDDTLDLSLGATGDWAIGANNAGTEPSPVALAEFWLDDTQVTDITKFYCTGRPSDLGATGNTPTGSAPALYLSRSGSGNSWATDSSGNGNNWSLQDPLGTTTSP